MNLVLGSSSKYRKKLLEQAGYIISVQDSPDIDEKMVGLRERSQHDARNLVLKVARAKMDALMAAHPNSIIITGDQVILCNGIIREKPIDEIECREYLNSYSEFPAVAYTGICVMNTKSGKIAQDVDIATQHWKPIPSDVIEEAIKQGDVMHCAGGFMIDSPIFEPFLGSREGDESTIIGMSLPLFQRLIVQVQD